MFEILMLASFSLIVLSRFLPEQRTTIDDDQELNGEKVHPPAISVRRTQSRHPADSKRQQPCRHSFGRAA